MVETLVPGSLGTVTFDTHPMLVGQVVGLNLARNVMGKKFIGQAWGSSLGGQRSGSFSASGSVSAESHPNLHDAFDAGRVVFSIQIGTAAGATDAGLYTGTCEIGSFNITVNGDGEWDWSLDAQTDGAVVYTPAV